MDDGYEILFEPYPDEELKYFVTEGVDLHTIATTGLFEWYPSNFFLRSERGEWLGGLYGSIWGGWLHVKALWVIKSVQRRGHGRRLLEAAKSTLWKRAAQPLRWRRSAFKPVLFTRSKDMKWWGSWTIIQWATPSISCESGFNKLRRLPADALITKKRATPEGKAPFSC